MVEGLQGQIDSKQTHEKIVNVASHWEIQIKTLVNSHYAIY